MSFFHTHMDTFTDEVNEFLLRMKQKRQQVHIENKKALEQVYLEIAEDFVAMMDRHTDGQYSKQEPE